MAWTDLTIPPAPVLNGVGTGAAERQLSAAGSRSVVPLVYGEDRLAGLVLNVLPAAAGSATLLVQLLWCYACDSVSALKLNDQDLPTGSSVTHYTGSQTTPDASLVAAFAAQSITYTAALTGYAYSVVSLPIRSVSSAEFNFAAVIRGRKVYDPRKDSTAGGVGSHRFTTPSTWEWSDNPTLCLADYSSSIVYGAGTPIDWTTVPAAANANDALVGGEARRIVGVSFIKPVEAAEAIETLRAYAGCWVLPGVYGVRLVPDADAASCASYSHAAGDIAAIQPLALRDTSRAPTAVEVIYTDRSKLPWRDASAIAQLPGAGTTKPWRLSQVRLPGVARYSQALREATERLNKLTLCDLSTSVEIYDIGIRHEIGDIILLSHPLGLDAKAFRVVTSRRVGPGRWVLDVVEHDAAVYSNEVVTAPTVADTSWVSPAGPPAAVTGFTAVPDELGVLLRWDKAPEKDVIGYELRIGGSSWETALPLAGGIKTVAAGNSYRWLQPASGTYTLRIKALDSEGQSSTTATVLTPTVTSTKLAGIQAGATVGAQWGVNINGQPSDLAILNANVGLPRGGALNANPECSLASEWTGGAFEVGVAGVPGGTAVGSVAAGVEANVQSVRIVPVSPLRRYRVSAKAFANVAAGAMYLGVYWHNAEGAGVTNLPVSGGWGGGTWSYFGLIGGTPSTSVTDYSGEFGAGTGFPVPAGMAGVKLIAICNYAPNLYGGGSARHYLSDFKIEDVTDVATVSQTATTAASNASAALVRLQAIDSDGVLARGEKPEVIAKWLDIYNEGPGIDAQAVQLGITTERTAWANAKEALRVYLVGLTPAYSDTTQDTLIVPAVDRVKWADYYSARQTLLNKIAAVFGSAGGVNMIWGPTGISAGPGSYGVTLAYLKTADTNRFGLLPGEQITISADVWQDGASAAAGQYAQVYLYCMDASYNWTGYTVTVTGAGQTNTGSRGSATLTLPADAQMRYVAVGLYHQGGSSNTVGAVYCDRVQVERGPVATQYSPGAEPGATKNLIFYQDSDPGAQPDGTIWVSSTKSWVRSNGAWRPNVGDGSVDTTQLALNAATLIIQDTNDFAGSGVPQLDGYAHRTINYTPAVGCTINFSATISASAVLPDSGNTLYWAVSVGGGADVTLAACNSSSSSRQTFAGISSFTATAGVPLTFKLLTSRPFGNPTQLLFQSSIRIEVIKR